MTSKPALAIALVLLLGIGSFGKEPSQTPQQLIELSRRASDFAQIGPYQLRATVLLNPGTAREIKGQITVQRNGGLYRSELQLAQYQEVRWINENKLYIGRSLPVPVPKTSLLRHMDRLWRASLVPPDAKVSKIFKEKRNHKELDCFEISRGNNLKQRFCFDSSTSVLALEGPIEFHEIEFLDYSTFEQKYFPTRILFRERDRVALELRDISITNANFGPETLVAPSSAQGFDTCDDPVPAYKIKDAIPDIPRSELRMLGSTEVYVYGLIAADGTMQNLKVQYAATDSFARSAIDAIRQWRYSPTMCGNKAVPMETEMWVRYFIP